MGFFKQKKVEAPDPQKTAAADMTANNFNLINSDGSGQVVGHLGPDGQFVQGIKAGQPTAVKAIESDTTAAARQMLEPASLDLIGQMLQQNQTLPDQAAPQDTSDLARALYDRSLSLLQPEMDRSTDRMLTSLQARGMPVGSEGFNDTSDQLMTTQQDTLARLAMDSTIQAGQEQSRQYAMDRTARQDALNEIMSLMSGAYSPGMVQMAQPGQGSDIAGMTQRQADATNQSNYNDFQTRMGLVNDGLTVGALLYCSETFKVRQGYVDDVNMYVAALGLSNYVWRYQHGQEPPGFDAVSDHAGPMAEEFFARTGLGVPNRIAGTDIFALLLSCIRILSYRLDRALEALDEDGHDVYADQVEQAIGAKIATVRQQ